MLGKAQFLTSLGLFFFFFTEQTKCCLSGWCGVFHWRSFSFLSCLEGIQHVFRSVITQSTPSLFIRWQGFDVLPSSAAVAVSAALALDPLDTCTHKELKELKRRRKKKSSPNVPRLLDWMRCAGSGSIHRRPRGHRRRDKASAFQGFSFFPWHMQGSSKNITGSGECVIWQKIFSFMRVEVLWGADCHLRQPPKKTAALATMGAKIEP